MNSRERVLAAVNFEQPDRVPIDLGATGASGINAAVYDQLKRRMGVEAPTRIHGTMLILAALDPQVLERLHVDVLPLDPAVACWGRRPAEEGVRKKLFSGTDVYFAPGTDIDERDEGWFLKDAGGRDVATMPDGGYYFDFVRPTMSGARIDPAAFQPGGDVPDEELERFAEHGRFLYENTDKALLGWGASISMFGLSSLLSDNITQGALDEWLCMLMAEKETAQEMMGRYTEATIKRLELFHQAAGSYCFAWGVASDDAGTQKGELLSPDLFREMIKPHYEKICDWVHDNTDWKTFLHSCGSIRGYIADWIEAGIDILNPVQISAANMAPDSLMEEFGGQVVFWGGGCDTQRVLPFGTPEEVREHVRENIKTFNAGSGGFVFTQVHNIQQDVPVENIEAMLAAAHEFGQNA